MRVLILGGSGFIGRNLIKRLISIPQIELTVFDRVPFPEYDGGTSVNFVQSVFDEDCDFSNLTKNVDLIFHLISTSVPGTEQNATQELIRNVIPSIRLFEAAATNNVKHMVFLSSGGTVYGIGDSNGTPNCETDMPQPINTYGLQKLEIEEALRFVSRTSAMTHQVIRLSNPYGPGQNPHGPLGLVTKLVYQTLHHKQITIFGDGSVVRDFIYIDDAIQGILDIVRDGNRNDTYNLGTGVGISVQQVVDAIGKVLPEPLIVEHVPGRSVDVPVSVLDVRKFRTSCASFTHFVSLEEGIAKTAGYFREHA